MKQKYVSIGGKDFELQSNKTFVAWDANAAAMGVNDTLDRCYGRPSVYKKYAWEDLCHWCNRIGTCGIWISGYNCMMFTVHGFVEWNGIYYFVEFTNRHNRAWVCDDMPYCITRDEKSGVMVLFSLDYEDALKKDGWLESVKR